MSNSALVKHEFPDGEVIIAQITFDELPYPDALDQMRATVHGIHRDAYHVARVVEDAE